MTKKNTDFGFMYHTAGSNPRTWDDDFRTISAGGFKHLVLWDKENRFNSVLKALDLCEKHALRVHYLVNPRYLAQQFRGPKYLRHRCMGIDGALSPYFNPLDRQTRKAVFVPYMEAIAAHLGPHKAFSGVFLDDTLDFESIVSYSESDACRFREFLRHRYGRIARLNRRWNTNHRAWGDVLPPRIMLPWRKAWIRMWDDWCEARQQWWIEWSRDMISAVRRTESKPTEIVLGDDWYSLRFGRDVAGGFTPRMVSLFDSFSFDYTAGLDYLDTRMTNIDRDMTMAKDLSGDKPLFVFLKTASKPGRPFPGAKTVIAQTRRVLRNQADRIYYYVYRAAPGNYAEENCLANRPDVFRRLSAFIRRTA